MYEKKQLEDLSSLCAELGSLIEATISEANTQRRYDLETRSFQTGPQWPYYGGSKTTGALRRKSLDLTRALAEMRKP